MEPLKMWTIQNILGNEHAHLRPVFKFLFSLVTDAIEYLLNPDAAQSLIQKQSIPNRAGTLLPVHMGLCPDVTQWLAHRYHGDILATSWLLTLRCPITQLFVLIAITISTHAGTVSKGINADSNLQRYIFTSFSKIDLIEFNRC